jgi:hypothetical protein
LTGLTNSNWVKSIFTNGDLIHRRLITEPVTFPESMETVFTSDIIVRIGAEFDVV